MRTCRGLINEEVRGRKGGGRGGGVGVSIELPEYAIFIKLPEFSFLNFLFIKLPEVHGLKYDRRIQNSGNIVYFNLDMFVFPLF